MNESAHLPAESATPRLDSVPEMTDTKLPPEAQPDKPRTLGLKLFDFFLYPVLFNTLVFGASVGATFLTRHGDHYGWWGTKIKNRGDWLSGKFRDWFKMGPESAEMSKMVFFSWFDGSLLAPVVKFFEDRREVIGCWLDHKFGTKPEDLSVYDKEPKQSWLSVLTGRFTTAAVVVPTAYLLDKKGWNNTIFTKPGEKFGGWLAKKPAFARRFEPDTLKSLMGIGVFEAFYTTVCTAGLYFSSRFIARVTGKKETPAEEKDSAHLPSHCTQSESIKIHGRDDLKKTRPRSRSLGHCQSYLAEDKGSALSLP